MATPFRCPSDAAVRSCSGRSTVRSKVTGSTRKRSKAWSDPGVRGTFVDSFGFFSEPISIGPEPPRVWQ
eukprot:2429228-Prymnesium_polylepis.2